MAKTRRRRKKRPNIVLMGVDSLLADHMSCYGYHHQTTPHIDRFAEGGALFEKTYSAHIPTTSAYASMLTGLDAFSTQVVALRHKGGLARGRSRPCPRCCGNTVTRQLAWVSEGILLPGASTSTWNTRVGAAGTKDAVPRRRN